MDIFLDNMLIKMLLSCHFRSVFLRLTVTPLELLSLLSVVLRCERTQQLLPRVQLQQVLAHWERRVSSEIWSCHIGCGRKRHDFAQLRHLKFAS